MEKDTTTKITIWNEGRHEKLHPNVARIYPAGIHGAIAEGLKNEGFAIRIGNLDDPDQGLGNTFSTIQIFLSWFKGGEVFRSGCAFHRGRGRVFFFGPGHETFPIYHNAHVHRVMANAIRWAKQPHTDGRILSNWHREVPIHR
jgi:trehalose utilization protein